MYLMKVNTDLAESRCYFDPVAHSGGCECCEVVCGMYILLFTVMGGVFHLSSLNLLDSCRLMLCRPTLDLEQCC